MNISLLINMKLPTIVGIFIFISRENFMSSSVKHEKCFITSRPVWSLCVSHFPSLSVLGGLYFANVTFLWTMFRSSMQRSQYDPSTF